MKFSLKNLLPNFKKCMTTKCKTCSVKLKCDRKEKKEYSYEPLIYRPFENLNKILEEKRNGSN